MSSSVGPEDEWVPNGTQASYPERILLDWLELMSQLYKVFVYDAIVLGRVCLWDWISVLLASWNTILPGC